MTADDVRDLIRSRGRGGQIELARQAGVKRQHITNFMSGRRLPGPKLLAALGVTATKTISYVYAKKGACTTENTGIR